MEFKQTDNGVKMYQVSTLQALALGYTKSVIDVQELRKHGDTGLGTYEGVDGEMIMVNGHCYRAKDDGAVEEVADDMGVPFSSVCKLEGRREFQMGYIESVDELKKQLNNLIEEHFGLNSMHMVRIDGDFELVDARSESGYFAMHVTLKDMLDITQKAFCFEEVEGTLICVYYPDYMDGINAAGWHFHFISKDCTKGGHVFDIKMNKGKGRMDKISQIEIQLPSEPGFDTYALKSASKDEIKSVEQGK